MVMEPHVVNYNAQALISIIQGFSVIPITPFLFPSKKQKADRDFVWVESEKDGLSLCLDLYEMDHAAFEEVKASQQQLDLRQDNTKQGKENSNGSSTSCSNNSISSCTNVIAIIILVVVQKLQQ